MTFILNFVVLTTIINFRMSLLIVGSLAVDTIETPFDKRERALGGHSDGTRGVNCGAGAGESPLRSTDA